MATPILIVSFTPPFRSDDFGGLVAAHAEAGLEVALEERRPLGPMAGLEWLTLTSIILFIGGSYFGGMLKKLGEDHYQVLKTQVKGLYGKLVGPKAPRVTMIGTPGKVAAQRRYSLLFSLLAEAADGLRFKLLVPEAASEQLYAEAVDAFVDFLDAFHHGKLSAQAITDLQKVQVVGKTMLLAYDEALKRVVPMDPRASSERANPGQVTNE